jgi:transcriptional regulator with XRE-family HTH domain
LRTDTRQHKFDRRLTSQSPAFKRTVAVLMGDYQRRIARRIQSEREKLSLSHLELAAKVGTTDRTVRRWEAGETEPQPRHLRALADTFGLEVADIRPNLEAEENAVRGQLDRIEAKLDRLLAAIGPQAPEETPETPDVEAALDELAPQPESGERPGEAGRRTPNGGRARPQR